MIRVKRQPEPGDFSAKVRQKGTLFLSQVPQPTAKQWRSHDYWVDILPELHESYSRICAYSCHRICCTGGRSVEHFRPKNNFPAEAYEWNNYRLVFAYLNGCRGIDSDVLDPFEIEDDWFVIDFPSLLVGPAEHLPEATKNRIVATCRRLKLNADDACLKDRYSYVKLYCSNLKNPDDGIPWATLQTFAPFLWSELNRQGLRTKILEIMKL